MGKRVKYIDNFIYLFIYTFLRELTYWSDSSTNLNAKRAKFSKYHVIESAASITTKFCTMIDTTT